MIRLMLIGGLMAAVSASAAVKFGTPFADKMVLQREMKVRVWGTADAGEKVRVSFGGQTASATADAEGKWKVELAPMAASKEGRTLTAVGCKCVDCGCEGSKWNPVNWFAAKKECACEKAEIKDVLVGEVWMCSGQSNTDCPIWSWSPRYRDGRGSLALQMTRKPFVRLVKTPLQWSPVAKTDYKAEWLEMTPALFERAWAGKRMPSAMGYYYALELANALDIPIGLVDSSWGGTNIDAWTPRSGIASRPDLKDVLDYQVSDQKSWNDSKKKGPICGANQQPSVLWNGMVAAYAPMAVRGFIWYQGCHNAGEHGRYASKMHALYNGWAKEFGNPDLKLYFVQLTPWGFKDIALIQEAQAKFEQEQKNSAMAVINDVGNLTDIHPNDKATVARRLAAHALKRDYGFKEIHDNSPTLKAWKIEGNKFILSIGNAMALYRYNHDSRSTWTGFEIAGEDGKFVPAVIENFHPCKAGEYTSAEFMTDKDGKKLYTKGEIDGKELIISAPGIAEPKKLRYLYSSPWLGVIYNESTLPMGAFHIN